MADEKVDLAALVGKIRLSEDDKRTEFKNIIEGLGVAEKDAASLVDDISVGDDGRLDEESLEGFQQSLEGDYDLDSDKIDRATVMAKFNLEEMYECDSAFDCTCLIGALSNYGIDNDMLKRCQQIVDTKPGDDIPDFEKNPLDELARSVSEEDAEKEPHKALLVLKVLNYLQKAMVD